MSIRCVAERYNAVRIMLRISSETTDADMDIKANMLASTAEAVFNTSGSNVFVGFGRWHEDTENARTIEIVTREQPINEDMEEISLFVNLTLGLTCFATVEPTTAFELYEVNAITRGSDQ